MFDGIDIHRGDPRHPRLHPLRAAGQRRRGHPPGTPPRHARRRGRTAAGQQPGRDLPEARLRRAGRRDGRRRTDRRAGVAGDHRPPDRDPAPDGVRHPAPHHRADAAARCTATPKPTTAATSSTELRRHSAHAVADRADPVVAAEDLRTRSRSGLRYYQAAFFDVIPQVNAEVRDALQPLARRAPARPTDPAARLLDRRRPRRQSRTSPPTWCGWPPAAPPTPRWSTTSPSSPRSSRSCRCRRDWWPSPTSWPRWPQACDEPARADEPYRRALRVIHGRLTATAARDPGPGSRTTCSTSGLPPLRDAGRVAGRSRRHRRVAARQRQRGAGR